jgi:ribosomal protein S18 acetylase RimI-like enzyme
MKRDQAALLRAESASIRAALRRNVPEGCTVFTGRAGDVEAMAGFSRALFPEHPLDPAGIRRMLTRGHALAFGLKDRNGALAAFCLLECNRRQRRIYINEIGVRRDCQGEGLGRWLMESIPLLAIRYGYRSIASHIAVANKSSIMLHTHFGFTVAATIPHYYDDGGDAFYMKKIVRL